MSMKGALFLAKRFQIKSLAASVYQLKFPIVRHDNYTRCNFLSHHRLYSDTKDKPTFQPIVDQAPQILSKLFPQTADIQKSVEEIQREQKKKEEEEKKEQESSWKRMKLGFVVFGVSASVLCGWIIYDLGSPEKDENGVDIEDEFSKMSIIPQYFKRMWRSMTYYQKMIQEPSRDKLLPDPLKHPYVQPTYTLVLEMKDVLVHPDWTYQTGWRFKKRPGVDHFLEQLARHFEIVVYTADQGMTVFPILDALDPNGYIMYRLVRDATHFVDGHHVKNLDNLNRELTKVIVIDWDPNSTKLHPQNTFNIARWTGNDDDTTLFDLVAFLKTIATADVQDVREVITYYRQFENPLATFRENQQKALQMEEERLLEEKSNKSPAVKRWTPNFLSGGMAGLVVDIVLFPIDTIKTRLQSKKGLWRSGGFRGIYNGLGPAAIGSAPTAALFFCTYESMKNLLSAYIHKDYDPYIHMGSASIAEMVACLIRVPVEIAKQRRQTSARSSSISILLEAYRTEGIRRGLYRGFGSTIMREVPFSFIQFPIWEHLKVNWTENTGLQLTPVAVAICGAIAGGFAAAVTTPLDVAKTRIMLADRNEGRRLTVTSVLRTVYREGGFKGLFAGFVPRVLWITLGGAVFFGTYDFVTRCLQMNESSSSST